MTATTLRYNWDPRLVDGIAAKHRVITFDNRGVGPERDECWSLAAAIYPGFDSYQQFTDRRMPIAVLERRAA
jgi:hypothetical protein